MAIASIRTRGGGGRCVVAALPLALALALPAPALAIDPGVTYDPGSPAGKEYAIPLVAGRADGAGTENQRAAANAPFGIGITPPGGGGSAGGKAGQGGRDARGGAGAAKAPDGSASPGSTSENRAQGSALRARLESAESPAGTGLWTAGALLAVLAAAALLALVLRSRPQHARS